jgi:hypothetical protein
MVERNECAAHGHCTVAAGAMAGVVPLRERDRSARDFDATSVSALRRVLTPAHYQHPLCRLCRGRLIGVDFARPGGA